LTREGIRATKLGYAPMNIERTKAIELKVNEQKWENQKKCKQTKEQSDKTKIGKLG